MLSSQPLLAVRVCEVRHAAIDVLSLVLASLDGGPLPACTAGAHIDVALPNGMLRQYSLCHTGPALRLYEIAILLDRDGRGGSACAHRDIRPGDTLQISPPRNLFPLLPAGRPVLFAGGIGITPILAMAGALHAAGRDFELHYCSRSPERAAYRDTLARAAYAPQLRLYHDSTPEAGRLDAEAVLRRAGANAHLYVCGPAGFIRHVCGAARQAGWDESRVHFEHFAAPAQPAVAAGGFELILARRGQRVPVGPTETAAQALLAHGVALNLSCEQGVCGACLLPVLDGLPDHRDVFLSPAERDAGRCFTPCCSRALSPTLTIDL